MKTKVFRFLHKFIGMPLGTKGTVIGLNRILELKSQKCTELHVKEVRKRGNQTKTSENEFNLSDLDFHENEEFEEFKNAKYGR